MDNDIADKNYEQEWQWCLVGNIVKEHEYGEEHIIKSGNKQFRPNTKVFINLVYGGMGHERVLVIGMPRHSKKYIEIVTARKYIYNFRLQKVFKPAVLNRMKNSEWDWWGNTDEARNEIIRCLEWLNADEAAKEKDKLSASGEATDGDFVSFGIPEAHDEKQTPQNEIQTSQNEITNAEKRITVSGSHEFHSSFVKREKSEDIRLFIALVAALTLAMFLFGISARLNSSHNTTGLEGTLQQINISGDENEELPEGETATDTSDL